MRCLTKKVPVVAVFPEGGWMSLQVDPSEVMTVDEAKAAYDSGAIAYIKQSDYLALFRLLKRDRDG